MIKQVSRKEAILAAADDQPAFMFHKDEYGKVWPWSLTENINRTIYKDGDAEFAILVPDEAEQDEQDPEQEDSAREQDKVSEDEDMQSGGGESDLMDKEQKALSRRIDRGIKPKRKNAELDKGKIIALSNAGWSINKIADEMGASWQTIKNVLVKEKEKYG